MKDDIEKTKLFVESEKIVINYGIMIFLSRFSCPSTVRLVNLFSI